MFRNRFIPADIYLMIAAFVALVVYFWLTPVYHPDKYVTDRLTEQEILSRSAQYLNDAGYSVEGLHGRAELRRDAETVSALQRVYGSPAFRDHDLRDSLDLLAPYYYNVVWQGTIATELDSDVLGFSFSINTDAPADQSESVRMRLTPRGELLTLSNQRGRSVPVRPLLTAFLGDADTLLATSFDAVADSVLWGHLQFDSHQFRQNGAEPDAPQISIGEALKEGVPYDWTRPQIVAMAEYHLKYSGWDGYAMVLDTVALNGEMAVVKHRLQNPVLDHGVLVESTLHPYGALESMTVRYDPDVVFSRDLQEFKQFLQLGMIAVLVLFLLIALIRRLDARLIDMKFALTDAILVGVLVDIMIVLSYLHAPDSTEGMPSFMLGLLTAMVAGGAGAAIMFFVISGTSESITRTSNLDTLQTLDLLKRGFFYNKPVGLALMRGVASGAVMIGLFSVLTALFPNARIHIDTAAVFHADHAVFPALYAIATSGFNAMLTAYLLFLAVGGFFWNLKKSWILLSGAILLMGIFIPVLPVAFDSVGISIAIGAGLLLFLIWVYRMFGFATTVITLFTQGILWSTTAGWMISHSADMWSAWGLFGVLLCVFAFGIVAFSTGQDVDEIPEHVPSYITELSQRERMERELEIARTVQLGFLPSQTPALDGYDISAICRPAFDTGGDFYDFIPLDEHRTAIIIGDVSGKGIQAAFFMTLIKGFIQSLSGRIDSPTEFLSEINRLFARNTEKGIFVTMIYGILDSEKGSFTFARAGHNPPVSKTSPQANPRHLTSRGIGIGILTDNRFEELVPTVETMIPEGGFLMLYTDGITESMNLKRELYGDHRLLGQLSEVREESAQEIVLKIEKDIASFVGRAPQHDDLTMVVIRRNSPSA